MAFKALLFLFVIPSGFHPDRPWKAMHSFPQTEEEMTGVGTERSYSVSSLLNHQGRQPQGSDHPGVDAKILWDKTPCPRRVALGRIQSHCDDKDICLESSDAPQGPCKCLPALPARQIFGERVIDVEACSGTIPSFVIEAAEVRVSKTRVTVDGKGQDVER